MRILITRPRDDAAPLAEKLAARGHDVLVEPMLDIRFAAGVTLPLDGVQALLFTSANGVRAFATLEEKRDRPVYCVGDASAAAARAAGFAHVESASGNVDDLAALVGRRLKPENGALLHAAGANVAGDLANALKKDGFEVRRAVLYTAEPVTALSPMVAAALKAKSVDLVLFFSARTAENFVRLVRQAGLAPAMEKTVALGLSPAVLEAALGLPWAMMEAARAPQEADMIRAVARHKIIGQLEGAPATEETAVSFGRRLEDAVGAPVSDPPGPRQSAAQTVTKPRLNLTAWLAVALSLASAIYVLTAMPSGRPNDAPPAAILRLETRIGALERQIAAFSRVEPGAVEPRSAVDPRIGEQEQRLAQIAARLDALENAPPPAPAPAPPAVSAVPDDTIPPRLSTLEDRLATLEQRAGGGPDAGTIAAAIVESRRLSNEVARLQEQIATLDAAAGRSGRDGLLLAVGQLRDAAQRGAAFGADLRTVQALAGDDPVLAAPLATLAVMAERAVPTREALRQRFPAVAVEAARALQSAALAGGSGDEGSLQRWWSGVADRLANVATVRRVGDAAGDAPAARLARAERAAAGGDLAAAAAALEGLDPIAGLGAWREDANARLALDRGIEALLAAALAAMAR